MATTHEHEASHINIDGSSIIWSLYAVAIQVHGCGCHACLGATINSFVHVTWSVCTRWVTLERNLVVLDLWNPHIAQLSKAL
jgi:hypothetical protein